MQRLKAHNTVIILADWVDLELYKRCIAETVSLEDARIKYNELTVDNKYRCDWCKDAIDCCDLTVTKLGLLCDICIRAIESREGKITLI